MATAARGWSDTSRTHGSGQLNLELLANVAAMTTGTPEVPTIQNTQGGVSDTKPAGLTAASWLPGFIVHVLHHFTFVVPSRYANLALRTVGAYAGVFGAETGVAVCTAHDTWTGAVVALRQIRDPFRCGKLAQQVLADIKLLYFLQNENIVGARNVFYSSASSEASRLDVYIVTELLDSDLGKVIATQLMSDRHVQYVAYQIVRALKYAHSAGIFHGKLSPQNVAVSATCEVKLSNFSLPLLNGLVGFNTVNMFAISYLSPEAVHLSPDCYDARMLDMWALGCLLCELSTGQRLFVGKDKLSHLSNCCQLLGRPSVGLIDPTKQTPSFVPLLTSPYTPTTPPNPLLVDLVQKLLVYEPQARLTAREAICHPYFAEFHDPGDEPDAACVFEQEGLQAKELTANQWQQLIIQEVKRVAPS